VSPFCYPILILCINVIWFFFAVSMWKMAQVQGEVPWMAVRPRRQVWFFRTCHKDGSPSYIDPTPISRCHQSRCHETRRSPARGKWNFDHVLCVTAADWWRQSYGALILLLPLKRHERSIGSNGHRAVIYPRYIRWAPVTCDVFHDNDETTWRTD
jgi:hypothetical protein